MRITKCWPVGRWAGMALRPTAPETSGKPSGDDASRRDVPTRSRPGGSRRMPAVIPRHSRGRVLRLVGYGLGQAGLGMTLAWQLHRVLRETQGMGSPIWTAAALMALAAASYLLRVLEARDAEWLGQDFAMRVRRRVLLSVAERPWEPEAVSRWGVTLNRLATDLGSLCSWVRSGMARMLSASVTLAGLWAGLAVVDLPVAAWFAAVIGACLAAGWFMTRPLRRRIRQGRRQRGLLANRVGRLVQSGIASRHLGRVLEEVERVDVLGKRLRRRQVERAGWGGALRRVPELAQVLGVTGLMIAAVAAGPDLERQGWLGSPATVMLVLAMMTTAMHDIARAWEYRLAYEEGRRRIRSLLAMPGVSTGRGAGPLPGTAPVSLRFDGVRWNGSVSEFSAVARPGERILVVGPSGSGKSSLMRLAGRLLDPVSGTVRVDGVPLGEIEDLHRVVQLVSPDVPLRAGTVRQNLGADFGEEPAAALQAMAVAAGLLGEPRLFPAGLESPVTEGGGNLSSGARARLGLVRALVLNPRLLLIDDPAFLLDPSAEAALRRVLALTPATVLIASVREPSKAECGTCTVWRLAPGGAVPGESPLRHQAATG